jgi:hypothetical protein
MRWTLRLDLEGRLGLMSAVEQNVGSDCLSAITTGDAQITQSAYRCAARQSSTHRWKTHRALRNGDSQIVHPATRTSLRVTPSVNGGGGVAGHVAFNRLDSDQGAGVSKRALRDQALDEGDGWRRWRQKELGARLQPERQSNSQPVTEENEEMPTGLSHGRHLQDTGTVRLS